MVQVSRAPIYGMQKARVARLNIRRRGNSFSLLVYKQAVDHFLLLGIQYTHPCHSCVTLSIKPFNFENIRERNFTSFCTQSSMLLPADFHHHRLLSWLPREDKNYFR